MKLRLFWLALCATVLPSLALAGGSWWNPDWQFRKEITFDLTPAGADIAGTAQDVPVLIRLSLANFNYFNDTKPDGSDFRVMDGDDKTPLKFHFERYDQTNQMAYLWVHATHLTGGAKSDKIYAYYGNKSAPEGADQPGTYDVSQALVLHFGEASGLPQDSTAYKNHATASTAEATPASLIAGGMKFAGTQSVTVAASASLRLLPNQGFTASAWVKFDQPQAKAYVVALADGAKELALGVDATHAFASLTAGGAPVTVTQSGAEMAAGQWHFLAVTAGAGNLTLYVDGVSAGSAPAQLAEIGGTLSVGASARGSNGFVGEIDEVQAAKVARSADWIKAAAKSQGTEAPLVVYGADGQKEAGQASYFGTIIKNLTVDSWVVIIICIAMLVISIIIMVLKAFFLSGVERGNRAFLKEFAASAGDGAALERTIEARKNATHDDQYGTSTLYHVFHVGSVEIAKRAHHTPGEVSALTPQAIEAIRATMDATQVRENQRLSSAMVMLTIAISGGPFLGLLGTVIGVMITFAAIAASGDVNVNAIAPGVSAALAATVAGLAVAIPCLFGYNWLNTRIKAISADTRVFVDEFVARIAEQYL